ncbi:MAG: 1-acyl-sn-glycerol-3-phosphate acyltransferase [Acetobacteraceae bacterium]|nr:1-acyl-sn-glycerol-3-phosphate acyltransferase [Acetobacteraceae bacterium]
MPAPPSLLDPTQIVSRVRHLARRSGLALEQGGEPGYFLSLPPGRDGWMFARRFRAARRGALILCLTLPSMAIQAVCLGLPGGAKVAFPLLFWRLFARALGLDVRVVGELVGKDAGRPVIYVSNHSSWVDIPVVGGILPGGFIAKGDMASWPIVSTIARLGRTVFVSRQRGSTARERDAMRAILDRGDNLILFPEGTSSDGSRVLPFRSSFFALAHGRSPDDGARLPLIQPVSVVYDRLNGLPAGRAARPVFAWYGDMDIASHFWRMTQHLDMRVTVLLHAPLDPATFPDRKSLSQAVWRTVADGASMLRQNRPARPLTVEPTPPADLAEPEPAFA